MSHRYRPSSKCLRARKKKQIWVTYLHNNVGLSMKHLRSGANRACVACVFPPVLTEEIKNRHFMLFIYLQAACKLVVLSMSGVDSFMHSINVVDIGQLSTRALDWSALVSALRSIQATATESLDEDEMRISSVLIRCERCILRCFNFWVEPQNKGLFCIMSFVLVNFLNSAPVAYVHVS